MILKDIRSKLLLPMVALVALVCSIWFILSRPTLPVQGPLELPPESPYENKVAGIGIVESGSKDLALGTERAGVVSAIYVSEGQKVEKNTPLFRIADGVQKASLLQAKAILSKEETALQEATENFKRVENLLDKRAISQEEYRRRFFAMEKAKEERTQAQAEVFRQQALLDQHVVKAPLNGEILRINVTIGEYAPAAQVSPPLLIMGQTDVMHVRVEIDERDVLRFGDQSPATGILRGYEGIKIPLSFVEKSPFIIPKKTLMGDGVERVDTRVMEVVYEFDNSQIGAYSGQQMDVFIEGVSFGKKALTPKTEKEAS